MLLAKLDILIQGGEIMDKKLVSFFIVLLIITSTVVAQANNIKVNHEKMNYALIMSLSPSINKALSEIYKDSSKGTPQWGGWETEILVIDQLFGVGGSYDVTLNVHPYYGEHTGEGIDEIKIRVESSGQKIIHYKHLHDI
jgi:hypothetical protein